MERREQGGFAEETEEDGMTVRELEGSGDTLTASPWGIQKSGAGGLHGGARSGRNDTRKAPFVAAYEAGIRGRHSVRLGQGVKNGGQQKNARGITSGV